MLLQSQQSQQSNTRGSPGSYMPHPAAAVDATAPLYNKTGGVMYHCVPAPLCLCALCAGWVMAAVTVAATPHHAWWRRSRAAKWSRWQQQSTTQVRQGFVVCWHAKTLTAFAAKVHSSTCSCCHCERPVVQGLHSVQTRSADAAVHQVVLCSRGVYAETTSGSVASMQSLPASLVAPSTQQCYFRSR